MHNLMRGYVYGLLSLAAVLLSGGPAMASVATNEDSDASSRTVTAAQASDPGYSNPSENASPSMSNPGHPMSDHEIKKQIKNDIKSDPNLKSAFRHVSISTRNGKVTLSGKVKSEDEKNGIEQKAAAVVGNDNVTDNIRVSSEKY